MIRIGIIGSDNSHAEIFSKMLNIPNENGEYAFNIFGSTNIRKAGTTVKYYLRPIKTIRLKAQK